jgi:hypothetical protein
MAACTTQPTTVNPGPDSAGETENQSADAGDDQDDPNQESDDDQDSDDRGKGSEDRSEPGPPDFVRPGKGKGNSNGKGWAKGHDKRDKDRDRDGDDQGDDDDAAIEDQYESEEAYEAAACAGEVVHRQAERIASANDVPYDELIAYFCEDQIGLGVLMQLYPIASRLDTDIETLLPVVEAHGLGVLKQIARLTDDDNSFEELVAMLDQGMTIGEIRDALQGDAAEEGEQAQPAPAP